MKDTTSDINVSVKELTRLEAQLSKYRCPKCNQLLLMKTTSDGGIHVWCARPMNICPSMGSNEGAHGKNETSAYEILTQKMSKQYN